MEFLNSYFSDFTSEQQAQFAQLHDIYTEWNSKINVISRKDMDNFYRNHVLHSLSIATQFKLEDGMQVLDLGTGGGFPGIPLAIFFPQAQFYLVDSINKKLKVVQEVVSALGLQNVTTQHGRAEEIKNRKFEVVVSRAVAPMKLLWQWSKPLIIKQKLQKAGVPNGLICLKGGDLGKEIAESGCRPHVWDIEQLFKDPHFVEKYLLYQKV